LIARSNKLDAEAAGRDQALSQREAEAAEKLEAARAEPERIRAGAERDATKATDEAEKQSRHIITQANQQAEATRAAASEETDRLAGVREEVYGNLDKLHRVLGKELGEHQQAGDETGPDYPDEDTDAPEETPGAGRTARTAP
jgi:cell division septum initiation protein DivIVA